MRMTTAPQTVVPKLAEIFQRRIQQVPKQICTPESEGMFNLLYFVILPAIPPGFSCAEFFVRLSLPLHPGVKTRNDVGWHLYLQQHADPKFRRKIPKILFYSDNTDELGYEYTVLEKLPGETLSDIWETIDPERMVNAVVDVVLELRKITSKLPHRWFGGFTPNFKPGPYVEYTSYATDHIANYWLDYPDECYETLNLMTHFDNLADYWTARLERDIRIVKKHRACEALRGEYLLMLESFPPIPNSVRSAEPFIAHRDLILGNLLWDREEQMITGVLDWEFCGMYASCDWNPGNTLWATKPQCIRDGKVTQELLFKLLDERLKAKGADLMEQVFKKGTLEYHYSEALMLSHWIVRKHIEDQELENGGRVQKWIREFFDHTKILCGN